MSEITKLHQAFQALFGVEKGAFILRVDTLPGLRDNRRVTIEWRRDVSAEFSDECAQKAAVFMKFFQSYDFEILMIRTTVAVDCKLELLAA